MEKSRNRAVGRQVRKMIAAAMAAMLVFTSANVADVNAEETVLAVSENAVTGETGAGVVEAKKTGEPEVENGGAENREAENIDLDAETADPDTETADGTHTYKNGFCTDDGCDAYEPAVLTTGKYDIDANGEITDSDEAYEIGNAGQLYWFAGLVNGTLTDGTAQNLKANAVLTADITVNEDLLTSINTDEDGNVTNGSSFKAWRPMGMADEKGYLTGWYTGIFDGNGHSISGLYVNRDESDDVDDRFKVGIGLFGYYSGLTRNLSVLDSYMRGESSVGGIIGYIGYNKTGTVQNCYSAATVWGIDSIGGICGSSGGISKIENCYNMGNICGETEVGGICGDNHAIIKNCYNVGSVKGEMNVGGITGANTKGNNVEEEITDCYNRGNVTGDRSVGGISGYDRYGLIENCYSQSIVSGNTNVGGICGNGREDTFHNTYYDSNLYVGDAIGYKEGALTTEKTEGKPSQAFESGEIAYLLQAGREEAIWGQTLSGNDVQAYPVLGGAKVYQVTEYKGCIESTGIAGTTYNNANAPVVFGPHVYENGFCTICSAYEPAVLTTGKYDIDANGEKTDSDEAYEIGNAGQLYWFAGLVNGTLTDGTAQNLKANAVLTADITVNEDLLTSINTDDDGNVTNGKSFRIWLPMGKINADNGQQMLYAGIFDGKGHSISGLYANLYDAPIEDSYYTSNKNCAGLFGYHAGVTRNLGIMDSYIRGEMCVGGICAYNDAGTIQNCYSTATVYGESYLGGICGRSRSNSIIENCYNAGYVYGAARSIGGICGDNYSTIESCYNIGIIEGNFMIGGIVGGNSGSGNTIWIKDCYNRGNVIGDTKDIGGIGGYIGRGLVENCYSQATVSGNTNVGGICGNGREDTFHNTYYDSNLYVGDAIGYKEGALTTEKTEGKPSQAFESGEIAYLLQAGREEAIWGQTLSGNDVQAYPVLGGARVYQNITYQDCAKDEAHTVYTYANEQKQESYDYTLQEVKAKEPKCTEAGNKAYYKCSACGKLYTDQEGTNEVSANTVVVPAKGHSFTWIIDREATEQAEGSRHEECSICHEKKAAVAIPKLPSSTQPSESPSQKPSGSPSQKPSESPSQKPSESPSQQPGQDIKVPAKGTKLTAKGASYQVTSAAEKNPTVVYKGSKKQKASVTIPDTVTIDKVTYKVTSIAANAFKNNKKLKKVVIGKNVTKIGKKAFYGCSKLKKITVKTTKLTKKNVGSQAFKGIHKKAAFKVPKKKISSYRKVFRARGAAKTTKVTK